MVKQLLIKDYPDLEGDFIVMGDSWIVWHDRVRKQQRPIHEVVIPESFYKALGEGPDEHYQALNEVLTALTTQTTYIYVYAIVLSKSVLEDQTKHFATIRGLPLTQKDHNEFERVLREREEAKKKAAEEAAEKERKRQERRKAIKTARKMAKVVEVIGEPAYKGHIPRPDEKKGPPVPPGDE